CARVRSQRDVLPQPDHVGLLSVEARDCRKGSLGGSADEQPGKGRDPGAHHLQREKGRGSVAGDPSAEVPGLEPAVDHWISRIVAGLQASAAVGCTLLLPWASSGRPRPVAQLMRLDHAVPTACRAAHTVALLSRGAAVRRSYRVADLARTHEAVAAPRGASRTVWKARFSRRAARRRPGRIAHLTGTHEAVAAPRG